MTKRFTLRKGGSDPAYPWELRDLGCPTQGEHDFSSRDEPECKGECDAYMNGRIALYWLNNPNGDGPHDY